MRVSRKEVRSSVGRTRGRRFEACRTSQDKLKLKLMAFHPIQRKRGNGLSLGTTFSVHKDGRITFTKDMAREMGFKEGDSVEFGWEDSSNPPTLSFRKVGKESGNGFTFHVAYNKIPAHISAKQVLEIANPGRYRFVQMDRDKVLTDCPVTI